VSELIVYTVPGRPKSWQRRAPMRKKNGELVFVSRRSRGDEAAKAAHQLAANVAMRGKRGHDMSGTWAIEVTAYYPDNRTGDVDRIAGLPLDALQGIVYEQDRQVVSLAVHRHVDAERPRTEVRVWRA